MVLYPNKLPESERVCSGICTVGHKRIEAFSEVEAQAFRLIVEQCVSTPLIRNFSIYHVAAQSDRQ